MRSNLVAAALYTLPVVDVLVVWYVLLFVADGSATPQGILTSVLTEAPQRKWFDWLLAAPVLWGAVAIAHLTPVASRRAGSIALNSIGACLGVWAAEGFDAAVMWR